MAIRRFTEIVAWQQARELTRAIYAMTRREELARDYPLRDQLRRAALSVMSNIAEGFGRATDRDFLRFLDMSRGSLTELQSLLIVCRDIDAVDEATFSQVNEQADKTLRLVAGFQDYLRQSAGKVGEESAVYDP